MSSSNRWRSCIEADITTDEVKSAIREVIDARNNMVEKIFLPNRNIET